jgi:ribosomal protein S27E
MSALSSEVEAKNYEKLKVNQGFDVNIVCRDCGSNNYKIEIEEADSYIICYDCGQISGY